MPSFIKHELGKVSVADPVVASHLFTLNTAQDSDVGVYDIQLWVRYTGFLEEEQSPT